MQKMLADVKGLDIHKAAVDDIVVKQDGSKVQVTGVKCIAIVVN